MFGFTGKKDREKSENNTKGDKIEKININIKGSGDFIVVKGKIVEANGESFEAEKKGNILNLSTQGNNIVSVRNDRSAVSNVGGSNYVQINGMSISTKGNTLIVNGTVDKIILNGEVLERNGSQIEEDQELGENEYLEYEIKEAISTVSISGSGSFSAHVAECGCDFSDSLVFSVTGSGDIIYSGALTARSIVATVTGSGEICFKDVHGDSIIATVTGSGDITAKNCNFESVNKNVIGSGDIHGL